MHPVSGKSRCPDDRARRSSYSGCAHDRKERADVAYSAAVVLEKCQLIRCEHSTRRSTSKELGRIASHYHVTYDSMMVYNKDLHPTMSAFELFRVCAVE